MPSSVVFAALVLAWLVVLVPVVARRRQMVPRTAEADLSAKVLPRGAVGSVMEEVPVANAHSSAHSGRGGGATAVAERTEVVVEGHEEDDDVVPQQPSRERVLDRGQAADDDLEHEYADEFADEFADDDPDAWEPREYRPGRGGFDAEAAEVAAHASYAFRQRVALGLITVAVLSAVAALVVTPVLWWLHVTTDVVLVGYLVFLRRQTRIDAEVRARRAARASGERRALEARRERQEEHDDRMSSYRADAGQWDQDWGAWDGDTDEYGRLVEVDDDRDDLDDLDDAAYDEDGEYAELVDEPAPRWAAPRTPAPAVPDGMELVDDSDDDPAFHRLDGRDALHGYRRAAAGA